MEIHCSSSKCACSVLTTSFWLHLMLLCQGVTFRIENGELVIARILHGGMIDQQGLLHVGDIIKEVNGREVGDDPRVLQEMLQETSGSVVLKILPSYQEPHPPRQVPSPPPKYRMGHWVSPVSRSQLKPDLFTMRSDRIVSWKVEACYRRSQQRSTIHLLILSSVQTTFIWLFDGVYHFNFQL